jgi:hypothetical protein
MGGLYYVELKKGKRYFLVGEANLVGFFSKKKKRKNKKKITSRHS